MEDFCLPRRELWHRRVFGELTFDFRRHNALSGGDCADGGYEFGEFRALHECARSPCFKGMSNAVRRAI